MVEIIDEGGGEEDDGTAVEEEGIVGLWDISGTDFGTFFQARNRIETEMVCLK